MKIDLRIVKVSCYIFDEVKNEWVIDEGRYNESSSYTGSQSSLVIPRIRGEIESKVRNEFELGDEVTEKFYDVNDGDLKKESLSHPVLEYKARYVYRSKEAVVWEVHYMELEVPDVSTSYDYGA